MRLWLLALPIVAMAAPAPARDVSMTLSARDYHASASRIARGNAKIVVGKESDGMVPLKIKGRGKDPEAAVGCVLDATFWAAAPEIFSGAAASKATQSMANAEAY